MINNKLQHKSNLMNNDIVPYMEIEQAIIHQLKVDEYVFSDLKTSQDNTYQIGELLKKFKNILI